MLMLKNFFFSAATAFIFFNISAFQMLHAQSRISGLVLDENNQPITSANVLLLNSKDSGMVKGILTDKTGKYAFENIAPGKYRITFSFIGFQQEYTSLINIADKNEIIDAGTIKLAKQTVKLSDVKIQVKKPMFEQKVDRMIINVSNSITSAGGTALDILERSPGVIVNRQSNTLSILGKDGVQIMINGKITHMPVSAIVQMLAGMNSSNIERIELITTPPANFDAEGNAGYINIVLINNPNEGLNGSYSLTMGYGKGETPSASINFNYRKRKINLYGEYSFSRIHQEQIFFNYRKVDNQGSITENYTTTVRNPVQRNHNLRVGLDYDLTKKTVIGALVSAYDNKWFMDAHNSISIFKNQVADTLLSIYNNEVNHWQNLMFNANIQHTYKPGEILSFNLDYLYYHDDNPNDYINEYYNGRGNFLYNEKTRSGKVTPIKTWVSNADYKKNIGSKIKMEAGIKSSIFKFNNDVEIAKLVQNTWAVDPSLSAKYILKEDIEAAYTSFDYELNDKTAMKFGLRYEYTNSNLETIISKNIVDRHYGKLFPTFFISRKINENNSINFTYNKRITRPTFNDLAPFTIFLDPNTFFTGNSALQPSISDGVKFNYNYKKYLFSVDYTFENNPIASFQTKVDVTNNKQYVTAENLKNTSTVNVTFSLPFDIAKWWSTQNNFIGSWQMINAFYDNTPLQFQKINFNIFSSQNIKLNESLSAEVSGFYQSAGFFGTARFKALGAVNAGIQKKLKKNYGKLRFSVDDIFTTIKYKTFVERPEQHFTTRSDYNFSQRTFKLTYSRNFGNNSLKEKRNRSTGSEEEMQRVK